MDLAQTTRTRDIASRKKKTKLNKRVSANGDQLLLCARLSSGNIERQRDRPRGGRGGGFTKKDGTDGHQVLCSGGPTSNLNHNGGGDKIGGRTGRLGREQVPVSRDLQNQETNTEGLRGD